MNMNNIANHFKHLRLKRCYLLLFMTLFLFSQKCFSHELPDLGLRGSGALSETEERQLGKSIIAKLRQSLPFYQDPIVNDYVQSVGYRLVATHSTQKMPYQFFVVADRTVNAFALPGGLIGVNSGILLLAETESEFASVIAHEVAHVRLRHIAQLYEHAGRLRLSAIAGMIAAVVLATQSPEAGTGAMMAAMAGATQSMINFTREHEVEADYLGLESLANAGFDPRAMPAFFERMYQSTRYYNSHVPEYFQTHPLTENRIEAALSGAKNYSYFQVKDSLRFHLIRARIQASQFVSPKLAVDYFSQNLAKGTYNNKIATQYGLAISLIALNEFEKASDILKQLETTYPNENLFQLALGQVENSLKKNDEAISRLSQLLKNNPNNYAATLGLSQYLLESSSKQNHKQALKLLEEQLRLQPNDLALMQSLTNAHIRLGNKLEANLTGAQARSLEGDVHDAIIQLNQAKRTPNLTSREIAQLDARIEELKLMVEDNKMK